MLVSIRFSVAGVARLQDQQQRVEIDQRQRIEIDWTVVEPKQRQIVGDLKCCQSSYVLIEPDHEDAYTTSGASYAQR